MLRELEELLSRNSSVIGRLPVLSWYGGVYRYLLDTGKAGDAHRREMLRLIRDNQTPGGGFRIETEGEAEAGSVIETAVVIDLLLDLQQPRDSTLILRAGRYLLTQQREDGS